MRIALSTHAAKLMSFLAAASFARSAIEGLIEIDSGAFFSDRYDIKFLVSVSSPLFPYLQRPTSAPCILRASRLPKAEKPLLRCPAGSDMAVVLDVTRRACPECSTARGGGCTPSEQGGK